VRDRPPERAGLRSGHIHMDPLVVVGGVREPVDPVLGHLQPIGVPEVLTDLLRQLIQTVDGHVTGSSCR
jgi:hypothetical protein